MKDQKQNTFTIILFTVYISLLTGIILFKLPFNSEKISDGVRVISLIPFHGSFDDNGVLILREIIQNTLLFIPLGIYSCMLKRKWPFVKKILVILSLSLVFEVLQFIFALGRSDITDMLDNTLGGALGIGIYVLLNKIFRNRTDKVINMLAVIVTVCVVLRFTHLFYLSHFVMRRLQR